MLQRNEIQNPMGAPEVHPAISEATDALKIEEVLRRARQIHRQHGGIFGYDLRGLGRSVGHPERRQQPSKFRAGSGNRF